MSTFLDWYNATIDAVSPAVSDRMKGEGFYPTSTGGGCMAWQKDEGNGAYWLVCDSDALLDGDTDTPTWVVGHYVPNATRTDETWVTVDGCTLPAALGIMSSLRTAPHGEYHMSLSEFTKGAR